MDDEETARIQERDNLKVALATFALRLDAFEMRMSGARLAAGQKQVLRFAHPNGSEGKYGWGSLNLAGNKSGT